MVDGSAESLGRGQFVNRRSLGVLRWTRQRSSCSLSIRAKDEPLDTPSHILAEAPIHSAYVIVIATAAEPVNCERLLCRASLLIVC